MPDRSLELLAGLITALKADGTVAGLVGDRIYDRVPQAATYPLVQLTEDAADAFDGSGLDGWEAVIRVDVWSRKRGAMTEALEIGAAIQAVVHDQALTLSAGSVVQARLLPGGARTLRDNDAETVNREMRFRFVVQD